MNFYAIGALICRFRGHRFGKAKNVDDDSVLHGMPMKRIKTCVRCGLEREVKRRVKVTP